MSLNCIISQPASFRKWRTVEKCAEFTSESKIRPPDEAQAQARVAATIRSTPEWCVRRLVFVHHGRDLLNDHDGSAARIAEAWGRPAEIARDAMTLDI